MNGRSAQIEIDLSGNVEEFIFSKNLARSCREGAYELMSHNVIENDTRINKWRNPDDMNTAGEISHNIFVIIILILFVLCLCNWVEIIDMLGW